MNRRGLLAHASVAALTGSLARAQPLPVISDTVPPRISPGPLSSAGAPSLNLDFMSNPGTLDPRITFTRASTATYFNAAGTMQTAAVNAPRWDYNPSTLALNGLLIEEARTNLWLQSADASNAAWVKLGTTSAAPVVTANQTTAPDGTLTAARVVFPAVSVAGSQSVLYQQIAITTAAAAFSVYMKGSVGGEQLYLDTTFSGTAYNIRVTLTTTWQRFVLPLTSLTGANWVFDIGTNLQSSGQTSTSAQTVYMWGAQVEQGGSFPTSYIPTVAATVTRNADLASMSTGTWFNTTNGTYQAEFVPNGAAATLPVIISGNAGSPTLAIGADSRLTAGIRSGAAVFSATGPLFSFGAVNKAAFAYLSGASTAAVNGTTIGPNATALSVTGTTVEFGSDGVTPGNNALDGWLRRARYWPRVLSNFEMQSVTT